MIVCDLCERMIVMARIIDQADDCADAQKARHRRPALAPKTLRAAQADDSGAARY